MQPHVQVGRPEKHDWTVCVNQMLAGGNIHITATATTHFINGMNSDPYPSPDGTFLFTATDTEIQVYIMTGTYPVVLRVTDEDGGAKEIILVLITV